MQPLTMNQYDIGTTAAVTRLNAITGSVKYFDAIIDQVPRSPRPSPIFCLLFPGNTLEREPFHIGSQAMK